MTHITRPDRYGQAVSAQQWCYNIMNPVKVKKQLITRLVCNQPSVNLSNLSLSQQDMEYLSRKGRGSEAVSINLSGNHISPRGILHLSRINMHQLCHVSINNSSLNNQAVKYLSRISFSFLQTLHLWNNQIGSEGVSHLVKANYPNLKSLSLTDNLVNNSFMCSFAKHNWQPLQNMFITIDIFTLNVFRKVYTFQAGNLRRVVLEAHDVQDYEFDMISSMSVELRTELQLIFTLVRRFDDQFL